MRLLRLLLPAILACQAAAQVIPPTGTMPPDSNRPGPWDNDVLVYRVAPDKPPQRLSTFERAGVPTVARLKDGRLIAAHQHFPENDRENFDKVAVRFSIDEGRTWGDPQVIQVKHLPEGMRFPFDPTLVPLADGRVRLYFTGSIGRGPGSGTPAIHSAISSDGVNYVYEAGVRFGIPGRMVIDCAVAVHDGVFHLIAPDNGVVGGSLGRPQRGQQMPGGDGYHAVSRDGMNFERVADVKLPVAGNRWLGNLLTDGGKLVFFGTGPGPWPVISSDGVTWQVAADPTRVPGADPGAAKLRDDSWLLLVTGEPRPGTPSASQRGGSRDQRPGPQPPGGGSSPRDHHVLSATSSDGLTWTRDEGIRLSSASVPCAINDGDRRVLLYVVCPPDEPRDMGGVSCAVSSNGVDFSIARHFRIEGLSTRTAADPSILKDSDGKFRLYYLASNFRGDPARGENPHQINLALSGDGLHFRETGTAFSYNDLVDPDVFRYQDRWFMYVFAGRGTVIATSPDGRNFQYLRDMTPPDWGTTAAVPLSDGRLRLYAFEQRVPIGNAVRSFLSTNGLDWIPEPGERLRAQPDEQVTDPFVIPWRGGWKMYFKTSPARSRMRRKEGDAVEPPLFRRGGERAGPPPPAPIRFEQIDAEYKTAPDAKPDAFVTGRDADPLEPRPRRSAERASGPLADDGGAGELPRFQSVFVRIPSSAAGKEGVAASVLIPRQPRFTNGAPVVISVTGGVQPGSARGRPEHVRRGFLEIHFAFPGGGAGEERSGGTFDFRGPHCIRALADVIRFATGRIADKQGRFIGELALGLIVLTNNVGLIGSSHGGNACGLAMAKFGEEFPNLAWYASMESPYGEGAANVELGGHESGVNPAYDPKTGLLDLAKLAWSSELSPGLQKSHVLRTCMIPRKTPHFCAPNSTGLPAGISLTIEFTRAVRPTEQQPVS